MPAAALALRGGGSIKLVVGSAAAAAAAMGKKSGGRKDSGAKWRSGSGDATLDDDGWDSVVAASSRGKKRPWHRSTVVVSLVSLLGAWTITGVGKLVSENLRWL